MNNAQRAVAVKACSGCPNETRNPPTARRRPLRGRAVHPPAPAAPGPGSRAAQRTGRPHRTPALRQAVVAPAHRDRPPRTSFTGKRPPHGPIADTPRPPHRPRALTHTSGPLIQGASSRPSSHTPRPPAGEPGRVAPTRRCRWRGFCPVPRAPGRPASAAPLVFHPAPARKPTCTGASCLMVGRGPPLAPLPLAARSRTRTAAAAARPGLLANPRRDQHRSCPRSAPAPPPPARPREL